MTFDPQVCSVLAGAFAAVVTAFLAYKTRDITFTGPSTDNEKQVRAAAAASEWRWPSDMHRYGSGKTRAKDAVVLALAIVQRALRNRTGDHPTVVLCLLANLGSAVLVFLIGKTYWNVNSGLLVAALFFTSFWPHWIALFGGHVCVAQTFFLASVYLTQQADLYSSVYSSAWYFASGIAAGLMLFSSPSARKYLLLSAAAFVYSQRLSLTFGPAELTGIRLTVILAVLMMLLGVFAIQLSYRTLIRTIYMQTGPAWLNRLIEDRSKLTLDHFLNRTRGAVKFWTKCVLVICAALLGFLVAGFLDTFFLALGWVCCGLTLVTLFFTLPNVPDNLRLLLAYWNVGSPLPTRFRAYVDYFQKIGKPIHPNMRGAGLPWIASVFLRILPFHSVYYLAGIALAGYAALAGRPGNSLAAASIVLVVSVSPIAIGELTRGPQIARSYYPQFLGLLLWIGYSAFVFETTLSPSTDTWFWLLAAIAITVNALWSGWIFVSDVWPARMAPALLAREIRQLPSKPFWTYKTPYNDAFVNALPAELRERVAINFINTLNDVNDGYVIVPGTSSKAFNMESQTCAIKDGDFDRDPALEDIIRSRKISDCAVASFKTFGTSLMWAQESEVTSYRDLILHEITGEDRWRGRAWILDASKIRKNITGQR